MSTRLAVGLDLGGTTLTGLLVDEKGRVRDRRRRLTPRSADPGPALEEMRSLTAELLEGAGHKPHARPAPITGIGAGIAGPVDSRRGVSLFSPNLGWRDVAVGAFLERAFGLPVRVDNDVRAATLGEGWIGAARPYRTYVVVTVGTGVGSGLVLDGRLWRGPGFSAGEIGHYPLVTGPEALPCGCGRHGCLETLASGTAIAGRGREVAARGESAPLASALRATGRLTARDVAQAARRGDPVAQGIIETAAGHLAVGLAATINLINPEAVIIGGGVAGAWDLLSPVLEREVRERAFPPCLGTLKGIFPAALGEEAGAVGAASLILFPEAETQETMTE